MQLKPYPTREHITRYDSWRPGFVFVGNSSLSAYRYRVTHRYKSAAGLTLLRRSFCPRLSHRQSGVLLPVPAWIQFALRGTCVQLASAALSSAFASKAPLSLQDRFCTAFLASSLAFPIKQVGPHFPSSALQHPPHRNIIALPPFPLQSPAWRLAFLPAMSASTSSSSSSSSYFEQTASMLSTVGAYMRLPAIASTVWPFPPPRPMDSLSSHTDTLIFLSATPPLEHSPKTMAQPPSLVV
ncbi:uncharacterized protein LY79DRAFT_12533 [Colletotrichum navitas]|uniref:Uncharacterized protein n=1 Tax=Colletotrichum navitas TaxID=681940 RepID=A0AAD8QCS6_9PEZI|nr:uncharacterized protein LY79DRAFT_12533 [Colletotrichum navitas]KAK1600262.1 hypothetical protein LY79DRAFT_12533 [Colletotrichum navitas]